MTVVLLLLVMDGRGEWLFLFFFFSPGSIDIRHHGLVELSSNVGIIDPEDSASERKGMFEGRVGDIDGVGDKPYGPGEIGGAFPSA